MRLCHPIERSMRILPLLSMMVLTVCAQRSWERAGCHRIGHTRRTQIPGCLSFNVTTNACRGFCVSYSFPSPSTTLNLHPAHVVTSRAECCSMGETHDVTVRVNCYDGYRRMVFKSAKTCSCQMCSGPG